MPTQDRSRRQFIAGAISQPIIGAQLYPQTGAERDAGIQPTNDTLPPYHVSRYGAIGDDVADDTSAIQRAIDAARAPGGRHAIQLAEGKSYRITSTIVLSSNTLAPVDVIGASPEWFGVPYRSRIRGDFDGPLFSASGVVDGYAPGPTLSNVNLENLHTGASAGLLRADYSGGVRMSNIYGLVANIGVRADHEMISPEFREVCISRPNGYMIAGYRIHCRNAKWIGGRVFAAKYALDIAGDTPIFTGINIEFSQVVFRHREMTGALFLGCHFESSELLITNAAKVPVGTSDAPYVNKSSNGSAIQGAVQFLGCTIALSGTATNLVVIKSGPGFGYMLVFDSCFVRHSNPIVGKSFSPGSAEALPSGTKIVVRNTLGLKVQNPPADAFSGYLFENTAAQGYLDVSGLKIGGREINSIYDEGTYTPTWSSNGNEPSLGNGTISGKYSRSGNRVDVKISLKIGSETSFGTGDYSFSLPIAASTTSQGVTRAVSSSRASFGAAHVQDSNVQPFTTAGLQYTASVPHAWASGDMLEITVSYFS